MTIVVTGAGGQLGWELCQQLGPRALALSREQLDVAKPNEVRRALHAARPAAVINAAAYTAVDKAESEPELCRRINALAVGYLADACRELDCPLLQVSTDYVFGQPSSDRRPHTEDEPIAPQGVYAKTKAEGETQARQHTRHFIVRTCGLYGAPAPGKRPNNFVETMLRLGAERDTLRIVDDQFCTPSYVRHVARAILFLLGTQAYGTYHVANAGSTSWFGFAEEIFRLARLPVRLERISTAQYAAPAPRPSFSVLDTSKYHALGGPEMPDWKTALAEYLASRVAS
jgi:dTDP-4-dehydrorhamnose reductase